MSTTRGPEGESFEGFVAGSSGRQMATVQNEPVHGEWRRVDRCAGQSLRMLPHRDRRVESSNREVGSECTLLRGEVLGESRIQAFREPGEMAVRIVESRPENTGPRRPGKHAQPGEPDLEWNDGA